MPFEDAWENLEPKGTPLAEGISDNCCFHVGANISK